MRLELLVNSLGENSEVFGSTTIYYDPKEMVVGKWAAGIEKSGYRFLWHFPLLPCESCALQSHTTKSQTQLDLCFHEMAAWGCAEIQLNSIF